MEVSIFPKFKDTLDEHYVEVHLNTDPGRDEDEKEQNASNRELQVKLTESLARPIYVILDPVEPDKPVAIFDHADLPSGSDFGKFLRQHAGER